MKKLLLILDIWLSEYPDSFHQCDMDRFHQIFDCCETPDDVYELLNINLKERVKICQPDWGQSYVAEFCKEWNKRIDACGHYRLFQLQK